jgi:hypothetical protein
VASVLHGSARTTSRIRAELKAAKAPARLLAGQYGLNVKTVLKWRGRVETTDAPMGPKPKSTVLTPAEEAIIVEFRRRTLLPLDDVLGCLKGTIPNLSRSALHRCLQRHGISRLPASEATEKRKLFRQGEQARVINKEEAEKEEGQVASSNELGSIRGRAAQHALQRAKLDLGRVPSQPPAAPAGQGQSVETPGHLALGRSPEGDGLPLSRGLKINIHRRNGGSCRWRREPA